VGGGVFLGLSTVTGFSIGSLTSFKTLTAATIFKGLAVVSGSAISGGLAGYGAHSLLTLGESGKYN